MKLHHVLIVCLITCLGCKQKEKSNSEWVSLFDGDNLDQWETYLGPHFGEGVTWENIESQDPVGLNNDSLGVFSIVNLNEESVLRISGQTWGGIFTKNDFSNFHLQLQFKWGEKKWFPRGKATDKRDSGLLYYGIGKNGEDDLFWLKSQEFQIQEGDCGDFWGVGGTLVDVRAEMDKDSLYFYSPRGELLSFGSSSKYGRTCKKNPNAENPTGQWNTIDLYCFDGTSIHMVNGVVTMILHNSRYLSKEGEVIPLSSGKIELQSESAEIYYKDIRIKPINSLPKEFYQE